LHLKRANVDTTVTQAPKISPALVVVWRGTEVWIACVNRWTAIRQCVGESSPSIALQGAKQRIGIDLIARASQIAAAIITA
jgi:hypothetical protein